MAGNPRAALRAVGELAEDEIDLAEAALLFARATRPSVAWRPAAEHLHLLAREGASFGLDRDDLPGHARALAQLMVRVHGYRGDTEDYDAEDNANLISVIERKRGLPVSLGILWIHAARAAGVIAAGLDFPGHFLIALRGPAGAVGAGGQVVIDPFDGGARRSGAELRRMLQRVAGADAELTPAMVRPMPDRAVLLRLQNNIRLRRARGGNVAGALDMAEDMLLIAPHSPGLWEDAAMLQQSMGRIAAAVVSLQKVVELARDPARAASARAMLAALRAQLN